MKKLVILLGVLGFASMTYAVMLADFETDLSGFIVTGTPASTLALSTEPKAVTSGAQCLKVTHAPNYWPIRWVSPTVPAKLGILQVDVTLLEAEWPTDPWTRFCEKIALQSNGAGGGWAEYVTTTANWKDRNTGEQAPVDWGGWDGTDMQRTLTIDISNYNLTGATYFQINFSMNCGTAGPYYIDNLHFVDMPNTPNPENGGVGVIGADTMLSWVNANDSLNSVKVWFGHHVENPADPNTILSLDTYKNLLTNIYTEATPGATSSCPMPALTDGFVYTWCVESDPNTVPVPFWTFTASTNIPPVANAGADQYVYDYTDPNYIIITLNGSGSDDGLAGPLTYQWEQTAGALTAVINSSTSATTTVALVGGLANNTEAGAAAPYEFTLTVNDGQFGDTDTLTVFVNSSSCTASIEAGSNYFYGDIAGPAGSGDENRDCKVDLYDFAELALNWLACADTFEGCN